MSEVNCPWVPNGKCATLDHLESQLAQMTIDLAAAQDDARRLNIILSQTRTALLTAGDVSATLATQDLALQGVEEFKALREKNRLLVTERDQHKANEAGLREALEVLLSPKHYMGCHGMLGGFCEERCNAEQVRSCEYRRWFALLSTPSPAYDEWKRMKRSEDWLGQALNEACGYCMTRKDGCSLKCGAKKMMVKLMLDEGRHWKESRP